MGRSRCRVYGCLVSSLTVSFAAYLFWQPLIFTIIGCIVAGAVKPDTSFPTSSLYVPSVLKWDIDNIAPVPYSIGDTAATDMANALMGNLSSIYADVPLQERTLKGRTSVLPPVML